MTHAGRPVAIDLRPHWITVTQDSDRNSGKTHEQGIECATVSGLSKNINSFKIMETFSFFIGIDISKATLDFAVVVANKLLFHFQSTNDKAGIGAFIKHLKTQCPNATFNNSLYCMEHTARAAPRNL